MTFKITRLFSLLLLSAVTSPAQSTKPDIAAASVKVFMVLDITVHDTAMYEQYRKNVEPLIKKYGGKYLVRSGGMAFDKDPEHQVIPVQGNWNPNRFIIVQWNSIESLQKFSTSAECIAIAALRDNSAVTKSIIVKEYLLN